MKFTAVLLSDYQGGYIALCRHLPDCKGRGPSPEAALDALRHRIVEYFEPVLRLSSELVEFALDNRTRRPGA